jgi:hypothetical protein
MHHHQDNFSSGPNMPECGFRDHDVYLCSVGVVEIIQEYVDISNHLLVALYSTCTDIAQHYECAFCILGILDPSHVRSTDFWAIVIHTFGVILPILLHCVFFVQGQWLGGSQLQHFLI